MLTSDQVFALFKKWQESSVPVQVGCFFRGGARPANVMVQINGLVKVVHEPTIVVSCEDGSRVEMHLKDCQFKSGDNVVSGASKELTVELGLSQMIQIDFPTGESCIVTAFRPVN